MQIHNEESMSCSHPGCDKKYKYRQNQLEHICWGHCENKECPCTVCGKMFQMPTNMGTHRLQQHGQAHDLILGYPVTECNKKHSHE